MSATAFKTLPVEALHIRENGLLTALPVEDFQRIQEDLEPVWLNSNDLIYEYGSQMNHVYFPRTCVISLLEILEDGTTVEVAMVGNPGLAGVSSILGSDKAQYWANVQIAGEALRMKTPALKEWIKQSENFSRLTFGFLRALITQFCQRAACNCRHMILQRLCSWLLMTREYVDADEIPLTQDLISRRLGSRRASVTDAYNHLQKLGIVRYSRGHIAIVQPEGLKSLACECYPLIKEESDRIFQF
jgi:CRP-like cAMP-binding protein